MKFLLQNYENILISNRNNPTFLILLGKKSIIIMGYLTNLGYLCSADDIVYLRKKL